MHLYQKEAGSGEEMHKVSSEHIMILDDLKLSETPGDVPEGQTPLRKPCWPRVGWLEHQHL